MKYVIFNPYESSSGQMRYRGAVPSLRKSKDDTHVVIPLSEV